MSEQEAGTPPEDTPQDAEGVTSDTPDAGTATDPAQPAIPDGYVTEDRYKEVQSWATRVAQEKAELEQRNAALSDYEQFVRHGREQGWLENPEADDTLYDDPRERELAQLREQVSELAQWRQSTTAEQQQHEQRAAYMEMVTPKLTELGVPEGLRELVADIAGSMPALHTPQGEVPDLPGALKQVEELVLNGLELPSVQKQQFSKLKQSKQAPHIGQVGTAGTHALPLDATHSERVAAAMQQLQADQ